MHLCHYSKWISLSPSYTVCRHHGHLTPVHSWKHKPATQIQLSKMIAQCTQLTRSYKKGLNFEIITRNSEIDIQIYLPTILPGEPMARARLGSTGMYPSFAKICWDRCCFIRVHPSTISITTLAKLVPILRKK